MSIAVGFSHRPLIVWWAGYTIKKLLVKRFLQAIFLLFYRNYFYRYLTYVEIFK